ncbi:MAG TPA: hypothetical protein VFQ72_03770 [Candidatus Paceibacterota bacterium]|nr:hypothetical protein [Candidatus Paceibacterota bacterium]
MEHVEAYTDFLMSKAAPQRPLKVVADCSNGPASIVAASLARKLAVGSRVGQPVVLVPMNDAIDPDFPAHGPDPSDPRAMTAIGAKVVAERADFGVVFDGDGDRAVFVDENGLPIPSYAVAGFLAEHLPGPHVADTLVYQALAHIDPFFRTALTCSRVGRYYLNKALRENAAAVGAEFSGHYYFRDFFGADSAEYALMAMIDLISRRPEPVSALFSRYACHSVVSIKAEFDKELGAAIAAVKERLSRLEKPVEATYGDGLTLDFGDAWVNLRPSNTEPILRITAGAKDPILAEGLAREYAALLA